MFISDRMKVQNRLWIVLLTNNCMYMSERFVDLHTFANNGNCDWCCRSP